MRRILIYISGTLALVVTALLTVRASESVTTNTPAAGTPSASSQAPKVNWVASSRTTTPIEVTTNRTMKTGEPPVRLATNSITKAAAATVQLSTNQTPVLLAEQELVKSITLQQCIEQALAGNLDLNIERINPRIENWSLVRERSAFEPVASAQANYQDAHTALDPTASASLAGRPPEIHQSILSANPSLSGKLPTGTEYNFAANESRYHGDYVRSNFQFNGGTTLTLSQPLLKNFGFNANLAGLRVARKNKQIAELGLAHKLIDVISDVGTAYYELVFAIENHKAGLDGLRSAENLLRENRALVKAGLLSPLEVTQAEAGLAERQEAVIVAEYQIKERTNYLRLLMGADVAQGGTLVPVELPPAAAVELDQPTSIRTALELRPDYLQAKRVVEQQGIIVKYNRQQLWPEVDLRGSYGWSGVSPVFNTMLDNVADREHPSWSVGVVVVVPLGNGRARADYATSKLNQERALVSLKRQEQLVVMDVANAIAQARSNFKRIEATQLARRLAEESLQAEQKKLREGLSTSFLVLQAQTQLTAAHTSEIRARVSYGQALIAVARAEGSTLRQHGIVVKE